MSDEAFNVAAFCASAADDSSSAVCAVSDDLSSLGEDLASTKQGINTFFLLFGGAMVFFMQAGFAMLCAGSVRQKNAMNIMLKNILDACGGAIGFFCIGFGLAYGGDQTGLTFAGNGNFGLRGYAETEGEEGYDYAFFFFQFAFAATAATIVAGTVAERCKMSAYLCYSLFLSSFVYPVVAHSVWDDNGMLSAFAADEDKFRGVGCIDDNAIDPNSQFSFQGVVHMTGGLTALIAAIVLGPRKGRFYDDDGNPLETPAKFGPHSVSLQVLGTFILWVGWYGFNPGSALGIEDSGYAAVAGLCAVTTTLAAACGCVASMFVDSALEAKESGEMSYDLTAAMNGALGGLVAITAGTSVVSPGMSCIIGGIGGCVNIGMSRLLIRLRIDDAVDAIPVHFANGIWGVVAVGLFANESDMAKAGYNTDHIGLFYEWGKGSFDLNLLFVQLVTLLWIAAWVTFLMTPFFIALNHFGLFRVDPLEEEVGLDISHHRGNAYNLTGPEQGAVADLLVDRASKHGKVAVPETGVPTAPEGVLLEEEA